MSESEVEQLITLEGPRHGCILERNNSGAFKDMTGRVVRFGLGAISKKHAEKMRSADRIGITTVTVTQEMVGKTIGVYTAVEVKEASWNPAKKLDAHEQAQKNWLDWVLARGGFAGFANSVESFRKIIGK